MQLLLVSSEPDDDYFDRLLEQGQRRQQVIDALRRDQLAHVSDDRLGGRATAEGTKEVHVATRIDDPCPLTPAGEHGCGGVDHVAAASHYETSRHQTFGGEALVALLELH